MPRATTRALLALLAVVAALALVACGGDDGAATATAGGDGATPASGPPAGAFPVTIEGAHGSTTVEAEPQRVVALGVPDADVALALGVQPVAIADMYVPGGLTPWTRAAAGSSPEILPIADGVEMEKVAALRPDLILAVGDHRVDEETWTRLSRLAPTLAYERSPGEDGWQTDAMRIGRALGREDRARELVAETEALIASTAERHPEFEGATFTFSNDYQPGDLVTLLEGSSSTLLFRQLGLRLSPSVAGLPEQEGNAVLSREQIGLLDADAVVLLHGSPALRRAMEGSRLYQGMDAVTRGDVVVVDLNTAIALRTPTLLGIPYALDQVVPPLAEALAPE